LSSEKDDERGRTVLLKNFEKKNEKKRARNFLKLLLKIEMKRGSFT
jgi:hypothetical protein